MYKRQGQRTGSGKLYGPGGKLLYEGELLDGIYQGAGRLSLSSGDVLECSFEQGVAQGSGSVYRNGKLYLEGSFADGLPVSYTHLSGGRETAQPFFWIWPAGISIWRTR